MTSRWPTCPGDLSAVSLPGNRNARPLEGIRVLDFTQTHLATPGFEDRVPYLEGLVRLDEGPRIFTPLGGAALQDLKVGQRMQIVYGGDGHLFQLRPAPADTQANTSSKDST